MALFKNNPDSPPMAKQRNDTPVAPGQVNIIGQGAVIEGGLKAKSDVRIAGKVVGNVEVEGKTVVTPEGVVEGEVRSTHADIAGRVEGEVFVQDRLVLKSTAVVEGDIHTAKLVIEDGAKFTGTCNMGGALPKPTGTDGRSERAPRAESRPDGRTAPQATA